jgi:ribosomal protein L13
MEGIFTMNNTTYSLKKSEIESKWYIIDAENKPLGRVATEAAKLLRGKHKPTYTPNMDNGDHVIILNCSKVVLTGTAAPSYFASMLTTLGVACSSIKTMK